MEASVGIRPVIADSALSEYVWDCANFDSEASPSYTGVHIGKIFGQQLVPAKFDATERIMLKWDP